MAAESANYMEKNVEVRGNMRIITNVKKRNKNKNKFLTDLVSTFIGKRQSVKTGGDYNKNRQEPVKNPRPDIYKDGKVPMVTSGGIRPPVPSGKSGNFISSLPKTPGSAYLGPKTYGLTSSGSKTSGTNMSGPKNFGRNSFNPSILSMSPGQNENAGRDGFSPRPPPSPPVVPVQLPQGVGRADLMAQIRGGTALKQVEGAKPEGSGGKEEGEADEAAAMKREMRRRRFAFRQETVDEDPNEWE